MAVGPGEAGRREPVHKKEEETMEIEIRNRGVGGSAILERQTRSALSVALHRFGSHARRVRVGFMPFGAGATTCRLLGWRGKAPTVVLEDPGLSSGEVLHAAADALNRAPIRRWGARLGRVRRSGGKPISLRGERS